MPPIEEEDIPKEEADSSSKAKEKKSGLVEFSILASLGPNISKI